MPSRCPSKNCQNPRRAPGEMCREHHAAREAARRAAARRGPRFTRSLDSQVYLITAAQNATPVHEPFFRTLQVAAAHLGAQLVVIPLRYKNPTSFWPASAQGEDVWAAAVQPYLFNGRKKLGPHLTLIGDVKTQPTATSPLSGFESLTGPESCVIGHTKMQFRSVPVPSGRFPKILSTTGACTVPNYTDTRAGKLGRFHHFLGAVIVETAGKRFHLRQINADRRDGSFTDLDLRFSESGVEPAPPALALVTGDTHARFVDPGVDAATYGPGGMVETLNPQTLVFHDAFDGFAINPHHKGDPFISAAKGRCGAGNVRAEVESTIEFLRSRSAGRAAVVVSSNHDNFLARWVRDNDWRAVGANAPFYLETAQAILESVRVTPHGYEYADPFTYWLQRLGAPNVRALGIDESFQVGGIECGMHGHYGPNGARGSVRNLSRLGVRVISGHGHSPAIEDGHYRVGTSTPLRLDYTHGPTSWLHTHCVVYASGKRALLTIVDGEWRRPRRRAARKAA